MFKFFRKKVKFEPDTDFYKINLLLEELNSKGKLPIRLKEEVLTGLLEIAKNKDWYKVLDAETIEHLLFIYNKWQRALANISKNKIVLVSGGGGFEQKEYWEGTLEEYHIAKSKGIITENTEVRIIPDEKNYHGSYYTINEDGSIEEYMN